MWRFRRSGKLISLLESPRICIYEMVPKVAELTPSGDAKCRKETQIACIGVISSDSGKPEEQSSGSDCSLFSLGTSGVQQAIDAPEQQFTARCRPHSSHTGLGVPVHGCLTLPYTLTFFRLRLVSL